MSDRPPEHFGSTEEAVEEGCFYCLFGFGFFWHFMSLFYERHCVIDKGELKQLLNSKATNFRLWTNLLGCVSMFSSATPHPSPYPGCCRGRGLQVSHLYWSSYCSKAHALPTFLPVSLYLQSSLRPQEECSLTNVHKVEMQMHHKDVVLFSLEGTGQHPGIPPPLFSL